MRGALRVASVLSRFNLFYWGLSVAIGVFGALTKLNALNLLVTVIFASFPLHAYAALQLHRSIRQPEIQLSHQTPAGIRFVGFIALCLGVLLLLLAAGMLAYTQELVQLFRDRKTEFDGLGTWTVPMMRQLAGVVLLFGLITVVNVILNFRLLRWYYLVHKSDAP